MARSLTFLFLPIDAVGHVNACVGVAQELLKKGHKVVFAISNGWKGKLSPLGIIEKCYQDESKEDLSLAKWGELVQTMTPALAMPAIEKMENFNVSIYAQFVVTIKESDAKLREIVAEVKPDLVINDAIYTPAVCNAGIPWMILLSVNPLGISADDDIPPGFTGFSVISRNPEMWSEFRIRSRKAFASIFQEYKEFVYEKCGTEMIFETKVGWGPHSPYGNIYMYPAELNYDMHRPDPPNWYHFDTFSRHEPEAFEIPEILSKMPGKLVYVSLGTIGCSDLGLMRRLISICAKSPHRFIFSKGQLGDQLELADNMWGANSLPQTNILPMVDLVITHGGNNTITEAFYFGTKVLVLPLFCDQMDNGTRVEETGLGLQFDPYRVTEDELLHGIEILLENDLLEKRMKTISTRIKASRSQYRAAELIENVAWNNTSESPTLNV